MPIYANTAFYNYWKHGQRHGNMDKDMETWMGDMETWTRTWRRDRGHGNIFAIIETRTMTRNGKLETGNKAQAISLIHLPFAHRANETLSFVCRLLMPRPTTALESIPAGQGQI
jgi:hypothetical protein